jgi:geranylgeranyl diphosphate synthase type II
MLDKEFESRGDVTVDEYLRMVDGKTGALLQTSLVLGGLIGDAGESNLETLRLIGFSVGRAFQIKDDLLDLTADDDRWGKTIGGDLIEGKKTYLLLRALEKAEGPDRGWFSRIVEEGGLEPDEVPQARERIDRLGVLEEAGNEVRRYSRDALDAVERLPQSTSVDTLSWLLMRMEERLH